MDRLLEGKLKALSWLCASVRWGWKRGSHLYAGRSERLGGCGHLSKLSG